MIISCDDEDQSRNPQNHFHRLRPINLSLQNHLHPQNHFGRMIPHFQGHRLLHLRH